MMRMLACVVVAAAATAQVAEAAEERYDRRLDEAAAGIAASRMGSLRGSFDPGVVPLLVEPMLREPPARLRRPRPPAKPPIWVDGLAVAIEKKQAASPEL